MADFVDMTLGSLAYDPFGTAAPQIDFPPETEDVPQQPPVQAPAREAQPRQRVRLGTAEDAAAMLGCSRNTLYQRIHKAKQLLAKSIREVSYEEA